MIKHHLLGNGWFNDEDDTVHYLHQLFLTLLPFDGARQPFSSAYSVYKLYGLVTSYRRESISTESTDFSASKYRYIPKIMTHFFITMKFCPTQT